MKHDRVTPGSFAAVLSPLVGLVAWVAGAPAALGVDVPFTERVISTTADGAASVFATDLDGDGDTDVLSASYWDGKIAWYENDGGSPATFTERVISTSARQAWSVFATDLDGDGDTDVLYASFNDNKIAWYENDGGSPPTFFKQFIAPGLPIHATSVFATDLNGDGDTDVLFASGSGIVSYMNQGAYPPWFAQLWISQTDFNYRSVFATDVDGDGDTDVLSASQGSLGMLAVHQSDGGSPPTFTERVISIGFDFKSVFATDVDGDGDTDVLSASGEAHLLWHDNDGGSPLIFTQRRIPSTAGWPVSVFATDVDGDGDTDVLSASISDDKIAWYESDGASPPSFTERVISTTADGAWSVFATDLDGDGDTDVLSASMDDDRIAWYENLSTGSVPFSERVISTTADNAHSVFATDLDGDGDTDVLSASLRDDKIAWYESDGGWPPTLSERVITEDPDGYYGPLEGFADGSFSVFATDLDDDGDTDVLSASIWDDKIAWYESNGGSPPSFTERVISTIANGAASVFATDVDGDGDTDVLSASRTDHKIAWYESDGERPPSFTERVISTTANGATSVFATDLDGDGDTDVLSASFRDDKIAWYENDGGSPSAFTELVITEDPDGYYGPLQGFADGPFSVFATDLDGDGDTDVLSASRDDGKIAWYRSNGGSPPSFTERVISTTADGAWSVFATDLDGDGDTDVLSASMYDHKIAWHESNGSSPPTFTERVISTTADYALSVFATDLDGDGDTDVLSASTYDDKIAWYENLTLCRFDSACDGDVDLADFALYRNCMTGPDGGPHPEGCATFDVDGDLDVDLADMAGFQRAFGPTS